jgi:hypothetical protein
VRTPFTFTWSSHVQQILDSGVRIVLFLCFIESTACAYTSLTVRCNATKWVALIVLLGCEIKKGVWCGGVVSENWGKTAFRLCQ